MLGSVPLPPDISSPIILADWLELLALTAADGNSSHGDLQRALNRLGAENMDSLCTESMRELNRRVDSTGGNYPFTFSGTLLTTKGDWKQYTPYVFCLLLSYCDDAQKKIRGIRHEVMFEHLSCLAAKKYLGGEVVRFGSPRDTLPSGFIKALTNVCGAVGEWSCTHVGRTLRTKDAGLDLVAWKHFPDRQIGKLILFGHCASGANWDEQINELQPNDFCSRWLGGDISPIVKSFFIPHRIQPEVFEDRAISAKLFFDRCRIAYWVTNEEFEKIPNGVAVVQWCDQLLKRVKS
jgi:hypothetical protein